MTTFEIGQYIRAARDIDFSPHGTIAKGERGLVTQVCADGAPEVLWDKIHPGIHDWHNRSFVPLDPDEGPSVIALPQEGAAEAMFLLVDDLAAAVSRISKIIDALRKAAAAG